MLLDIASQGELIGVAVQRAHAPQKQHGTHSKHGLKHHHATWQILACILARVPMCRVVGAGALLRTLGMPARDGFGCLKPARVEGIDLQAWSELACPRRCPLGMVLRAGRRIKRSSGQSEVRESLGWWVWGRWRGDETEGPVC